MSASSGNKSSTIGSRRRRPQSIQAPVGLTIALTTGPGRNWASLWKPLIDAFGPVLGEDHTRPFHPHYDRIVSLGLHHAIDTGIAHDVIIDAWWTSL
jgi:hypothetical protein